MNVLLESFNNILRDVDLLHLNKLMVKNDKKVSNIPLCSLIEYVKCMKLLLYVRTHVQKEKHRHTYTPATINTIGTLNKHATY